jgi:hypothetical protein
LFIHVFGHRSAPYLFDVTDKEERIARHFFTGGIMPSPGLIRHVAGMFDVEADWHWLGTHYARTAQDWLSNFDQNETAVPTSANRRCGAVLSPDPCAPFIAVRRSRTPERRTAPNRADPRDKRRAPKTGRHHIVHVAVERCLDLHGEVPPLVIRRGFRIAMQQFGQRRVAVPTRIVVGAIDRFTNAETEVSNAAAFIRACQ